MKNKIKILIVFIAIFGFGVAVSASEVTGTLSTGLNANNGQTVNGVVITPPTATPVSGTYTTPQEVSLTTVGASSVRYTFDGTIPSCDPAAGVPFLVAIPISVNKTIKAVSCYPGGYSSSVATFGYIINPPQAPAGGGGGGGGGGGYIAPQKNTADLNKDGKIDKYDFSLMMANWSKTGVNIADLNGDLKVDKYDFALLMSQWGK